MRKHGYKLKASSSEVHLFQKTISRRPINTTSLVPEGLNQYGIKNILPAIYDVHQDFGGALGSLLVRHRSGHHPTCSNVCWPPGRFLKPTSEVQSCRWTSMVPRPQVRTSSTTEMHRPPGLYQLRDRLSHPTFGGANKLLDPVLVKWSLRQLFSRNKAFEGLSENTIGQTSF